jgi:hypothetical protein
MCMSEWAWRNNKNISKEALYAGSLLERYGFIFGIDFDVASAITMASRVIVDHMAEEESLLMEGKQIAEKIKIDEAPPRIQDRRTFVRNRNIANGWDI